MIRLAVVYFPSDKLKNVIPVKDIVDLPQPKGIDDFEPNRLYSINCQVLRREDSDTTEKPFNGKILLLGG